MCIVRLCVTESSDATVTGLSASWVPMVLLLLLERAPAGRSDPKSTSSPVCVPSYLLLACGKCLASSVAQRQIDVE